MESGMEEKLLEPKEGDEVSLKRRVWLETKQLWRVGGPAILVRLATYGVVVVTQAFMGSIGDTELAAYALISTIFIGFANGILLGMASALETLCGQAFGAKQYHMMGIHLQRSWIILIVASIIMLPFFAFAGQILRAMGQGEELSAVAGQMGLWFIPILFYYTFYFTMQMFLQAQLKNSIIAWLGCITFPLHLLLSWVMVAKLNWGVGGAMGAMIVSCWLPIIGAFAYILCGWCPGTWNGFSVEAFSGLWPVVKLCLSSGVMLCLELWYNSFLILIADFMKDAETAVSAISICLNISSWEVMIPSGFLTAISVRVANELGRGNANAAKFAVKVVLSTSLVIGVFFSILSVSFGDRLGYVFSSNEAVVKAVARLSPLLAVSFLLNSTQPVLSGVAVGAGWQHIVVYVNLACYYVIGIPLGICLGFLTNLEIQGIWIGMLGGIAVQSIVLICITWKTDWDLQVEKTTARLNKWLLPSSTESKDNAHPTWLVLAADRFRAVLGFIFFVLVVRELLGVMAKGLGCQV